MIPRQTFYDAGKAAAAQKIRACALRRTENPLPSSSTCRISPLPPAGSPPPWHQLAPNPIASDPAAVSWGTNRIDVFARGTDNKMYTLSWNGSQWFGWSSLGGQFTSGPAVASWGSNRLDVFGRGTDSALWTNSWTGASWSGWYRVAPNPIASDPAAVSW
ncbi:MAG TPA: hypothetical protein VHN14_35065, partial [Kofleriaceae bacterium]|nr:hypothetical protein [Kofleriaceae bacterium]